ncbi:unnamed protein product, partial [marine sediment metagenome]
KSFSVVIDNKTRDIHTMMPGRVEKYDAATQKANIKPLVQNTIIQDDGSEITESLPVITNVPIVFPRAGGFFISFPVPVGTFVVLCFCERSIDTYLSGNGGETDPIDLRDHDLSDAIAFIGFAPFSKAIKDIDNENLVIGKDDGGMQIKVKADDTVEITLDGGRTIKLEDKDSDATMTLGDGAKSAIIAEAWETFWNTSTIVPVNTHVHSGGGSGPPVGVLLQSFPSAAKSSKVTFPDG